MELTKYEYLILKTLLHHPQQVFTRGQIMHRVWPMPDESEERAVDTHIKGIRAKLREIAPEHDPIKTHRGIGYSIEARVHEL